MSVKARAVEKERAVAFDRGQFTGVSGTVASAPRHSYYYAEERRYEQRDTATTSESSSSSRSSSRSSSPPNIGDSASHSSNATAASHRPGDSDMSDDEEVVQRARAATRALLGGGSGGGNVSSGSRARGAGAQAATESSGGDWLSSNRLERYLRGRAGSAPTMDATRMSTSSSPCAPPNALRSNYVAPTPLRDAGDNRQQSVAAPNSSTETSDAKQNASRLAEHEQRASALVEGALQLRTTNSDFQQLMALFEEEVRSEKPPLPQQPDEGARTAVSPTKEARTDSDVAAAPPAATQQDSALRQAPRTFAALERAALEQLFNAWCNQGTANDVVDDGDTAEPDDAAVFIAADHRAAAFTFAMMAARDLDASSWGSRGSEDEAALNSYVPSSSSTTAAAPVMNAPLTWEELMQGEVARRNARGGCGLLYSPADVAEQARQQLRRFLQSVACIERLVNNRRFMRSVAVYLYEHHKVFLPHYNQSLTPSPPPAATPLAAKKEGTPAVPPRFFASAVPSVVEHSHEEYAVYEEFGQRVSTALLGLLSSSVEGFDEAEFVEALYDTPATFAEADVPAEGPGVAMKGPQNVLSFPAWRFVLAMSDFECFFSWMMDYIYEEYHLDSLEGERTGVAVAGARGLRALIRSTYKHAEGSSRAADAASATPTMDKKDAPATISAAPAAEDTSQTSVLAKEDALNLLPPSARQALSFEVPRAASSLPASPHLSQALLRPGGTLAPLPSSAALQPAPPPTRNALTASSSFGSSGSGAHHAGVHLCQLFPSPPASAEGRMRATDAGKPTTVYRKRQSANRGRNLPPITPSTDSIVRPSSAGGVEADDPDHRHNTAISESAGTSSLSASQPAPPSAPYADPGQTFASTAPPAAAATSTSAAVPLPEKAARPTRTRSSAEKKDGVGVGGGTTTSRRGSTTQKTKSRASSITWSKVGGVPKAKAQKPKLSR